ncbi:MAG: transaldolase [Anaerolineae bacterium]|nr:transaldolase [Anaerolineae bacterium]
MQQLMSKIFIDGGDAEETRTADKLLRTIRPEWGRGIDGQTTNPTLVAKNPDIQKYLASGKKLTPTEALAEYRKIVEAIAEVTNGPISIQVIADQSTPADEMLRQARAYKEWIPNGVVKCPCTTEGLAAAEIFCQEFPVNITLNFSQAQAAAVYQVTRQARHQVFVSPFVGRLDDRGENGMDLIVNELKLYQSGDGHVDVLTASVRTLGHLLDAICLQSPAITVPMKLFQEWANQGFALPDENFTYNAGNLKPIPYQLLSLDKDWRSYDLHHDLTEAGLTRFTQDWQKLTQ